MKNINFWYLRLDIMWMRDDDDKDKEVETINIDKPYVYSMHGQYGDEVIKAVEKHFGTLDLPAIKKTHSSAEFQRKLREIKKDLNFKNVEGKEKCIFVIIYWVYVMNVLDIVFVKKGDGYFYICEIISEAETHKHRDGLCCKRYIKLLAKLSKKDFMEQLGSVFKGRGRRTLERIKSDKHRVEINNFLIKNKF